MNTAALHTELTTDPVSVGYASALAAGNDNDCAALLNAQTGVGAATISLPSLTHDEFAMMIAPAVFALGQATSALQTKWTPMLNLVSGVQTIQLNATIMGLLNQLVTDGLLTAAELSAGITRTGSRAEVLLGVGAVVTPYDITVAMGRA